MKYQFIQNGKDDYTLKYKDKEINFKSTVNIVMMLQEANKSARLKLIADLSKQGISIKDLTKETKENGKTYFDNSNRDELEKAYIQDEQNLIFQEAIQKMIGIDLISLLNEIGLSEKEEIEEFSTELGQIMVGQFPSGSKTSIEKL